MVAHIVHPVNLECRILEQHCLAGLLVDLGDAQIYLNFFVQHRVLLIAAGRGLHGVLGVGHGGLGIGFVGRVDVHDKGFCLEHVLEGRGFHHQILPVGQALHPDGAGVIGENLRQLILARTARGDPAVAAAVFEVTGGSEGGIVRSDLVGICLIGFGNGLGFTRKSYFSDESSYSGLI